MGMSQRLSGPSALSEAAYHMVVSHSLQVTACVALHSAGVNVEDIAFCLHWNADSVQFYLQDYQKDVCRFMASAIEGAYQI